MSHLWYLAVDAQFYLIWPVILLLTPDRFRAALMRCLAAFGVVARAIFETNGANNFVVWFSLPANLDPLALGALLGWAETRHPSAVETLGAHPVARVATIGLLIVAFAYREPFGWVAGHVGPIVPTLECALYALLIAGAWQGYPGLPAAVLESWPLRFIGTVSFSLYIVHPIVNFLLRRFVTANGWNWNPGGIAEVLAAVVASLLVATLAWLCVERPLSRSK